MLCYEVYRNKCLCDFARCPLRFQVSVVEKKQGLALLLGVSREPRPRTILGWVADLFCVKTRAQLFEGPLALNLGLNVTWISFSCVQKHFLG